MTHHTGWLCRTLFPVKTGLTDAMIVRVRPKYQSTLIRSGLLSLMPSILRKVPTFMHPCITCPQSTFTDHGWVNWQGQRVTRKLHKEPTLKTNSDWLSEPKARGEKYYVSEKICLGWVCDFPRKQFWVWKSRLIEQKVPSPSRMWKTTKFFYLILRWQWTVGTVGTVGDDLDGHLDLAGAGSWWPHRPWVQYSGS